MGNRRLTPSDWPKESATLPEDTPPTRYNEPSDPSRPPAASRTASTECANPPSPPPGTCAYSASCERSSFDQRPVPRSSRRRYVSDHENPSSGDTESAPATTRDSANVAEPPIRSRARHAGQAAARALSGAAAERNRWTSAAPRTL